MNKQIEALLIERNGYVLRNLPARIKAVDEALAALGHKASSAKETATAEPTEERAVIAPVTKRKKV